jgi:hypothetical protein
MTEQQATGDPWGEVGRQFQALGESLAQAFHAAWEDEETHQHVQELQAGLEAMVGEIGQAIKQAANSPEGRRMGEGIKRAGESARVAGGRAWQDAQPHVLAALRKLNAELQKMIGRLEEE